MKTAPSHPSSPPSTPARRLPAARSKRSECLAGRTLLAVARRRKGLDATRCQVVFAHLDAAHALQHTLQQSLAAHGLTELQFAVLVALFALDPEPVAPADLADYTAVSRAAITDAVVRLESLQLLSRARDVADRRVFQLHLTATGQIAVERALMAYLRAAGASARMIKPDLQQELLSAYQRLQEGAVSAAA
ncbi:MarR family winged helix-turn-helix transcriptional regulator [Horticoccus sp. 23ND18S-11]|uniref:MarR family winged helix-turn-helix transcriptional regulator n=1 Tax=Horticoccus sp. 23ND18S-11 TaxID=3391832 RepID=UPI0039C99B3B